MQCLSACWVPSMKKSVKVVILAALAAVFHSIFTFGKILDSGWAIVISTLLSAFTIEAGEALKRKHGGDSDEE